MSIGHMATWAVTAGIVSISFLTSMLLAHDRAGRLSLRASNEGILMPRVARAKRRLDLSALPSSTFRRQRNLLHLAETGQHFRQGVSGTDRQNPQPIWIKMHFRRPLDIFFGQLHHLIPYLLEPVFR